MRHFRPVHIAAIAAVLVSAAAVTSPTSPVRADSGVVDHHQGTPGFLGGLQASTAAQDKHFQTTMSDSDCKALKATHPDFSAALGARPCLMNVTLHLDAVTQTPPSGTNLSFLHAMKLGGVSRATRASRTHGGLLQPMDSYSNGFYWGSGYSRTCSAYGNLCGLWSDNAGYSFAYNFSQVWLESGVTCSPNAIDGTVTYSPDYGGWCGYGGGNGASFPNYLSGGDNFTTIYGFNYAIVQVRGQFSHSQRFNIDSGGYAWVQGDVNPSCVGPDCG